VLCLTGEGDHVLYELPSTLRDPILRVVWFIPRSDGPERHELDLPLDPARDRLALPETPRSAAVRAALGVASGSGFSPLAVAWVYKKTGRSLELCFSPPGDEPLALRDRAHLA
jgi:hypothetical protein